jgi:hypothetical protein
LHADRHVGPFHFGPETHARPHFIPFAAAKTRRRAGKPAVSWATLAATANRALRTSRKPLLTLKESAERQQRPYFTISVSGSVCVEVDSVTVTVKLCCPGTVVGSRVIALVAVFVESACDVAMTVTGDVSPAAIVGAV